MEQPSPHVSCNSVTAEAIEVLDTGEKIFLFRDRSDPTISLHNYPRKKKKNFLNSKKAARASMNEGEFQLENQLVKRELFKNQKNNGK